MKYIKGKNVIVRTLNLNNIYLKENEKDFEIKIVNFKHSISSKSEDNYFSPNLNHGFLAPEIY